MAEKRFLVCDGKCGEYISFPTVKEVLDKWITFECSGNILIGFGNEKTPRLFHVCPKCYPKVSLKTIFRTTYTPDKLPPPDDQGGKGG
jgi:hypothetical protein